MRQWLTNALDQVIHHGQYSNLYLRNHLHQLNEKDRALATRIFYGTIQNHLLCRSVWKQYVKKNPSPITRIVLDMSVYQLLFLDKVPRYAIIDQAVSIVKRKKQAESKLVNAILHKIDDQSIQWPEDKIERCAMETSCPLWLIQMWNTQYGWDRASQMARASLHILPLYVRINNMKETPLDESYIPVEKDMYIATKDSVMQTQEYLEGRISIQDLGSYQIAQFMDVQKGDSVLDCCGAPGTKTFAMAEACQDACRIDSMDIHAHRVQLIKNDAKRLGITNVNAICQDATKLEGFKEYDRILCDVPCSGYGVLARKPDIKLHMKPEDMDTLIPLQASILDSASKHLKDNGILVYSTCTCNKKENEKQVEKFLSQHPNFELLEQRTIFPDEKNDGFYMAKMQYKKSMI